MNAAPSASAGMQPVAQQDPRPAPTQVDAGGSDNRDAGQRAANDGGPGRTSADAGTPRADAGNAQSDGGAALPDADAGTPDDSVFAGATLCSSRVYYRGGDDGSAEMNPGRACNECHRRSAGEEAPPIFSLAGTLYPTGHEPDDCYGTHPSGATIRVRDARGVQLDLIPNTAGNFMTERAFTFPVQVSVVYQGRVRVMDGPIERDQGDCNTCHTETGREDAPGRIALP